MTQSRRASIRLLAKQLLHNEHHRKLELFRGWQPKWVQVARLTNSTNGQGQIVVPRQSLIDLGILYNVSRLNLTAPAIERHLRARCSDPAEHWEKLAELFGVDELSSHCEHFARAAAVCPDTIRLALGGDLSNAVRSVPIGGFPVLGEIYERNDIFTLICDIARINLLASVISAGEEAYLRYYEPTGHDLIDYQPGRRATIYRDAGQRVLAEAARVGPLAMIYATIQGRQANDNEIAALRAEPRVVADAKRLQEKLEQLFGNVSPELVNSFYNEARKKANGMMAAVRHEVKSASPNQTLYSVHGTDPLPRLWLACELAMAWIKPDRGTYPLEQALIKIYKNQPLTPPEFAKKTDEETRKLFFLIRHLFARDPKAIAAGQRDPALVSAAVEKHWQEEIALHPGRERFDTKAIGRGRVARKNAISTADEAFLAEINGPIWIQLRLA